MCPACRGLGLVKDPTPRVTEHGDFPHGTFVDCPVCTRDQRQQWLAQHCGLEGSHLLLDLQTWGTGGWIDETNDQRKTRQVQRSLAHRALQGAIGGRAGFYTFYGDFGSGKTHALAVIVNEIRLLGIESYYVTMAQILTHLRSLIGQGADSSSYWQRLMDVPVLALDEVTRINATDWAQEQVFVLVDQRYRRRASHLTVFATNDDPNNANPDETMGYLLSRMREGRLIELRGDMRPAAAGTPEWLT